MADKLKFNLVSPERQLMSEDVDQVDVPGSEGIFGVLPNHSPFMSTLAPGVIRVKNGADETRIFVRGGFAEVTPAGLTILAEEAVPVAELDGQEIARRIKDAEALISGDGVTPDASLSAQNELAQLKQLQSAQ